MSDIYLGLPRGKYVYQLQNVANFSANHYMTYVRPHGGNIWYRRDDAATPQQGVTWLDILYNCYVGLERPSLLVYEASSRRNDVCAPVVEASAPSGGVRTSAVHSA
jgi:hypothetical protein